ncbi:pyridoxamine 5'-phosphate oxidase family protein [Streptomyces sp. 71268]|uniref:pyridoxamine 5'-phosphate oxidase family protein n=1 Tax=Streptomyces sp. 71268 TaxID=3002640 RepID=UPI0023F90F41|nr:pyridoxamine 5'-phosphate oxidase family protein [Streptomyces sp. 71268]WEV26475.1 pyridoxamine 5'-phosphate oxidase family protein [Streptomyces sp. 71268]
MPTDTPTADDRAIALLSKARYGRVSVSMRALPFVTVARHIVVDGHALLRLHRGFGYHSACDGSVVAYGADNADSAHAEATADGSGSGAVDVWSVQFVGTARLFTPSEAELALFGEAPSTADGAPYDPVYLRVEPQFVTVHQLSGVPARRSAHAV